MVSKAGQRILERLGQSLDDGNLSIEPGDLGSRKPLEVTLSRAKQRPELFDYQKELVRSALATVHNKANGLVSLPTGGGKTRTAVATILELLTNSKHARVIWLAPTIELLDQAHQTLVALWGQHGEAPDLRILRSLTVEPGACVVFMTPHALMQEHSIEIMSGWDLIVFDEAHQISAPRFKESVRAIQYASKTVSLIGLSATPGRNKTTEMDSLLEMFDGTLLVSKTLTSHPVEFLQRRGILAKLDFKPIGYDYKITYSPDDKTMMAVDKVADLASRGRQCLVFASSVAESEAIAQMLRNRGVAALHVDGNLEENERRDRIDLFASKKVTVLVNQKVLTTGYDCPAVSDLVILPKVGSPILFEQMVGRAARGPRTGGTRLSTIWQFDDHLAIHGLPQSYYRYRDYEWNREEP